MTKNNKVFSVVVLLIMSCFWMFWYPGVKVATDYHLSFNTGLVGTLPWSWRQFDVADGLGEYTAITLWSQPLLSLTALTSYASLGDEIQTKLMGAAILFFGILGIWRLLGKLGINNWGKTVGSVFFILNSFFLLMFDGGQFSLNLAYITLPYALSAFMELLKTGCWKERVKFALAVLLISIFDIRIILILALILGIYLLFDQVKLPNRKQLGNLLLTFLFTLFIVAGFHAYWFIPSFLAKAPSLPLTYDRVDQVSFLSFSSIGHSIFLQQPHWYKNIFGQINQLKFEFILIPILVFLSPILIRKSRMIGFWLTVAIIGIFLSKGSQGPFSGIYLWLFTNFPLFSLFRDPVKFYFLTAFAYSVLIGFTISTVSKSRFKIIPGLVLVYLIFLARPVYLGWMSGMISQPIFEKDYEQLAGVLRADPKPSRVLWLPFQPPLSFTSLSHPPLEASRLINKRPFAVGMVGTYETLNFLRESPVMGQLLEVSGVGYLAYPYLDPKKDDMSADHIRYYYTFLNQLLEKPWLSDLTQISKIPLLKVKDVENQFFLTPNLWWVIGSDSIYNEATKSAKLRLSKNALVFAEEYPGLGGKIDELPEAKIVLNSKTVLDLAASLVDFSNLIFPAKYLGFEPDKSGWWKREAADLIRWRYFLKSKYGIDNQDFDMGGGWAVGEKNSKFKIQNSKFKKNNILLARVMESSKSGELIFYQDEKIIGKINTKKEETNVRWFEVGRLNSDKELIITTNGDINVVNALSVLDEGSWMQNLKRAKEYQEKGRIYNFSENNTEDLTASITYQQINPTKMKVSVRGLTKPALLIFSQNFDQLWKLEKRSALPVYSLLNGFTVERDGDYIVEFEAQKYVYPGLIITGLTVSILLFLLIRL